MKYDEDDYLALSGIQHFLFCRRQWALIHIEEQWRENLRTIEGGILHEKAHDNSLLESRVDKLIARGLRVSSSTMGISGQCDVVEFHRSEAGISIPGHEGLWVVHPVEYKKGTPKIDRYDEAQLCAQAICLEEMLCTDIKEGSLYYGEIRHRVKVEFSRELREIVQKAVLEMHAYYAKGYTPKSKTGKWCNACSLKEICLPTLMKTKSVKDYVKEMLCESS